MQIPDPELPKWMRWFLGLICPPHLLEEIEGDLLQKFAWDAKRLGTRKAKRRLMWNTVRFLRPGILLRNKLKHMNAILLSNYLKVAFRTLWRSKSYSAITIGGLAIGIACSLVIFLFVYGEWSYDKGFAHANRTYRIGISFFNIGNFASAPEELLDVLPQEFAGVETATRIRRVSAEPIQLGDDAFVEQVFYTDTGYFQIFDYQFLTGSARDLFNGPSDAVITDELALKYFNTTDAVGETIEVGKAKTPFTVRAVVKAPDFNTHLRANIWLSNHALITSNPVWTSSAFYSYVLLREGVTEQDLQAALDQVFVNHVYPESGKPMGFPTLESYRGNDISVKFHVHKLTDIYLKSKLNFELVPGGNESNIYIFSAIAVFIFFLATINFINLSTARAVRRAKEVGVRKALGAQRQKLVGQFLMESVLISMIATVCALFLSQIFLKAFEYVTGSLLVSSIWRYALAVGVFVLLALIIGLISGIYPAFYLTAFNPIKVLKGTVSSGSGSFRNVLVVFQFTVSIVLMTWALTVRNQLHFMATKDLGFDAEHVLTIDNIGKLGTSKASYRDELKTESGVLLSSFHAGEPGSKRFISMSAFQTEAMEHPVSMNTYFGDEHYLALHGMRLVKGRAFNGELASDSSAIIFNEAALKVLGITGDPLGVKVSDKYTIVGVVSDFHWESLRNAIAPTAILLSKDYAELGFKLNQAAVPDFLSRAETRWKQLVPDEPFRYHFLDDNFEEMLRQEKIFERGIALFTLLSVFISCLGMYGLSAYTTEQRTKEIGIRKALGASGRSIVALIGRKFTVLTLIALVVSIPVSWFCIDQWLSGFAYRENPGLGLFIMTAVLSVAIGWATIGYHALKATRVNPAETLKYE
jgi:putative ABC transport system permease protein